MPDVLRWGDEDAVLCEVHRGYVELLADRLGSALAGIPAGDGDPEAPLDALLQRLPDGAYLRFLTAPETSCRLLWPARHTPESTAAFFRSSLIAEQARLAGPAVSLGAECWTALGDFCVRADGSSFVAPVLPGLMPLDFDSPYALDLDFNGRAATTLVPRERLDDAQRRLVLGRLAAAWEGIGGVSRRVQQFVAGFTKVLILQADPEAPGMFASGSSGQYVGRSVLSNPQLGKVDEVEIAEGLVHEAIHSLLYMQERRKRWVDPELYGPEIRTRSPWSHNPLPLRPYLQACFVWYGLLHFWAEALETGAFPATRVRERIAQCASGFLHPEFEAPLRSHRGRISDDIAGAIARMRETVCESALALR